MLRVPGHDVRACGDGGLQQPARGARPVRGRQGRRRRGRPEHRLHRRPAAGHHRLPQLRQPGEARGVLPVPGGLPGHRRRLPRVRHAGHGRQRELLQRESHGRRRSDPHGWNGRPARAGGGAGVEPLLGAGRRDPHPRRRRRGQLGGSAYWAEVYDFIGGRPARVDLEAERCLQRLLVAAAAQRLLRSAHDCSEGGLLSRWPKRPSAVPMPRVGSALRWTSRRCGADAPADGVLYGEDGARAVVSVEPGAPRGRHGARAASTGSRCTTRVASASPGGVLELRLGSRMFSLAYRRLAPDLFHGDPAPDAASGRGPLGGRVRHVRHHRRLRDP